MGARLDVRCFDHIFGRQMVGMSRPTMQRTRQLELQLQILLETPVRYCGGCDGLKFYWNGRARQLDPLF